LSEEVERKLAEGVISLANWGFGLDKKGVLEVVQNYIKTNSKNCEHSNLKVPQNVLMVSCKDGNQLYQ
jgi:hypothetical protein